MREVLTGFGVLWLIAAVGYPLGRYDVLGPAGRVVLTRLVFFVAAPALLFATLAESSLGEIFTPALAAFVLSTVAVALTYVIASRLLWRQPVGELTVGALAASYVNAANLGLPIAAYVLGDVSFMAPVLLFQVLIAGPVALAVLDIAAGEGGPSLRQLVLLPARNPIMLGSVAGIVIAATGWSPPAEVLRPFQLIGAAAVPAALLAFGMSLPGSRPLHAGPEAAARFTAVTLKVLVQPALAYLLARHAFGLDGPALLAAVVTSGLPAGQNVYVFATQYGQGESLARDAVLLSTLAAAVVLLAVAAVLR
jgi:malonate transporter